MKKTALLLAVLSGALLAAGCSDKLSATPEHCKPSYIKEIADAEGLDKAKQLTNECLEKGFDSAMSSINEAGAALKESLFGKSEKK